MKDLDLRPTDNALTLTPFGYTPQIGTWRTEAMRSYQSPRLIFFAKGQGRITIAGLTSGYGPNNLIYIPANTMFGFEVGPTTFGQILKIPNAMAMEWPEESAHLRLRDVLIQKELSQTFDNLERELQSDKAAHNRAAHYHLGLLAVFFERQLEQHHEPDRAETAPARLVAAYTDLVERDYRNGKTVAEFAADLGVTPTHLSRCCNQTCDRSALAILNDRILFEARILLRNSNQPIGEVARELGFASAAYFTRSFQNHTGTTPSAFRKRGPLVLS